MRTRDMCTKNLALCLTCSSHLINSSYCYKKYISMHFFIPYLLPQMIFSANVMYNRRVISN